MIINPYKNAVQDIEHTQEEIEEFHNYLVDTGIGLVSKLGDPESAQRYFKYLIQYMVNVTALQFLRGAKEDLESIDGAPCEKLQEIASYAEAIKDNCQLLENILDI